METGTLLPKIIRKDVLIHLFTSITQLKRFQERIVNVGRRLRDISTKLGVCTAD